MSESAAPVGSVSLRCEGGVAQITLSRHRRHNALDLSMWRQLAERVEEARALSPRALIVVGDGPHFCAGMDLKPDNPVAQRALARARALTSSCNGVGVSRSAPARHTNRRGQLSARAGG
jgi:enoyl-CoA hydratase/carnithine racemase